MADIYSNENFPLPVVEELRKLGHDVLTTHEAGKSEQAIPDEEVLKFASESQRVLVTLNRKHFIRLHNESSHHSGIVVCTFDPDFGALAKRIDLELAENPNTKGLLLRVNRPNPSV